MKINIYRDDKNEWRWQMVAKGRIMADSGEGYKRVSACRKSLNSLLVRIVANKYQIVEKLG